MITGLYLALMFGVDPGCGRGHITEACNVPRYFDNMILGANHMYNTPTYTRSDACSDCSPGQCPVERFEPISQRGYECDEAFKVG